MRLEDEERKLCIDAIEFALEKGYGRGKGRRRRLEELLRRLKTKFELEEIWESKGRICDEDTMKEVLRIGFGIENPIKLGTGDRLTYWAGRSAWKGLPRVVFCATKQNSGYATLRFVVPYDVALSMKGALEELLELDERSSGESEPDDIPDVPLEIVPAREGRIVGADPGVLSLLTLSDGTVIGENFHDYIKRWAPEGSKGIRNLKAKITVLLKRFDWSRYSAVFVGETFGSKAMRFYWPHSRWKGEMLEWPSAWLKKKLKEVLEERGVQLIEVSERGTSSHCPRCRGELSQRKNGSVLRCRRCNFEAHRDRIAALNILARGLGLNFVPPSLARRGYVRSAEEAERMREIGMKVVARAFGGAK